MKEGFVADQIYKGIPTQEIADDIAEMFVGESLDKSVEVLNLTLMKVLKDDRSFKRPKSTEEMIKKMWEENPDF